MLLAIRLAFGTAAALGLGRFAFGLLVPAMRDDLGWSLGEAGAMSTANGAGYLVGALLTTLVVHRLGTAFRAGMVVTALAMAASALTADFTALLALRAVAGVAGAAVFVTGGVLATRLAARAASSAPLTTYFAGAGLGIVFSGALIPALGADWRPAWLALALAGAVATAVSWGAAEAPVDAPEAPELSESGPKALEAGGPPRARVLGLWRVALAYVLFAAGYITYITFLSAYLAERHASVVEVSGTWVAMGLAVIAAPAMWNGPIARWPGNRVLALVLAVLGGGAALALVAPWAVPLSAVVYGLTFMAVPAAVTALIRYGTRPVDWTATIAVFTTLFAAGQSVGPWLAGLLADHTTTEATLAWTAVLCTAAALVAMTAGRTPPQGKEPA
ncbi:YbfB/YjiJ family MFS transporter [Nonomuraea sp. NBC_01738]|uniref:YbfB/YjiJ family MFS transporter n=1 Tax=Nonomuraea sp. NBC_01738 TaxID=2976003 RepID=UPI002E0EA7FD|nr:YbfB/YjiJ family MFS transporter [Nonomuraea sp. NBC_01738]